jgi:hypothetical protein
MPIPQEVSELVKRFECNRESYRSSEYNETQACREFIDPSNKECCIVEEASYG